jgi:hypothetical protein
MCNYAWLSEVKIPADLRTGHPFVGLSGNGMYGMDTGKHRAITNIKFVTGIIEDVFCSYHGCITLASINTFQMIGHTCFATEQLAPASARNLEGRE